MCIVLPEASLVLLLGAPARTIRPTHRCLVARLHRWIDLADDETAAPIAR